MLENKYNKSWKFWIDKDAFALVWNIPKDAREVDLPHDAMIEKKAHPNSPNKTNTGYRDGDIYNYVKLLDAPESYKNKTVMLKFEGVYMNAFVYINGALAAKNPSGYSTFYVNLNEHLRFGEENEIRVIVKNGAMTNSRWYTGGGIYRDVYLLVSDLTYIKPQGIMIKTESLQEDYAVVNIATEIKSRSHFTKELILETSVEDWEGRIISIDQISIALFEGGERKVSQRMVMEQAKTWSEDTPVLYTCKSKLYSQGEVIDESITQFGLRTLEIDAKNGLRVNGKTVKLRGACIHHDSGLLGAATYDESQYRQVKILKEAGFNAIRMAHQPMASSMLRACDQLGIYVMDEAFDIWTRGKSDYDYGLYFSEWWEKDIDAMVKKDYNHPSVIMYSLGNEIPELGNNNGVEICQKLSDKVKSMDDSRYTLTSINGVFIAGDVIDKIVDDVVAQLNETGVLKGNVNSFMTLMKDHMNDIVIHSEITKRLEKACAPTDIAGYNYMTSRYKDDGKKYPNRIIVGSETYPPEIAKNWELVQECNHVIGDFTWTGWDYIGEAGIGVPSYNFGEGGFGATYPAQLAYAGDMDITGFRRPASYFREVVFGLRKDPYITVQNPARYGQSLMRTPWLLNDNISSWTYKGYEGKPVIIEVYAPGDTVELLCNGKLVGRKPSGKSVGYRTYFDFIYKPGTLTAIAYEGDKEIGRMELATVDQDRKLLITIEERDNQELIYLPIEICDENGNLLMEEDAKLEISVNGSCKLIGFGSANPKTSYNYNETVTETFQGRALAILSLVDQNCKGTVKVSSDLYGEAIINLDQ